MSPEKDPLGQIGRLDNDRVFLFFGVRRVVHSEYVPEGQTIVVGPYLFERFARVSG